MCQPRTSSGSEGGNTYGLAFLSEAEAAALLTSSRMAALMEREEVAKVRDMLGRERPWGLLGRLRVALEAAALG